VGLKRSQLQQRQTGRHPFSRTPRGFEAAKGPKWRRRRSAFSRTPRGFEAVPLSVLDYQHMLSAEPLVGLKQSLCSATGSTHALSAEPLVGLKRQAKRPRTRGTGPFSRTPRGFEASSARRWSRTVTALSAEPLVGLKLPRSSDLPSC